MSSSFLPIEASPSGPPPPLGPPDRPAAPAETGRPLTEASDGRGGGSQQGIDLVRLYMALKRFRWLILGVTVAGLGGGIVATRYIKPLYTVNATIWIENSSRGQPGTPIQGEELLSARAWVDLLQTYRVLDPVVERQKLYLTTPSGPDADLFSQFRLGDGFLPGPYELTVDKQGRTYELRQTKRLVTEKGSTRDSIGRSVGFRWAPRLGPATHGRQIAFEVLTPREASQVLRNRLRTSLREQNFLNLTLTDNEPDAAAATMNLLITRFVDEAAAQKRAKLTLLAEVLDTQVINQADKLSRAEQALESYKVGTVTLPREEAPVAAGLQLTQPTVYGQYFQMRTALDQLRRDRIGIEMILDRAQRGELAVDAFNTIGTVKTAPDLQKVLGELSVAEAKVRTYLAQYTEEYKPVKDLREQIETIRTKTIPLYASALVNELKNQEGDLDRRIQDAGRELRQIPVRSHTEARLSRERNQAENLFTSLETSRQQARLAEASAIPDVRIVDSAVAPARPSKNSAPVIVLFGLAGGLGLGLGLALLLDRLDKRFRYPEQVSRGLGLPILGTVPQIKSGRNGGSDHEQVAQVVEAFRSVRLNLSHCYEPNAPISLVISSPSPGDGKSLICANLALSFAEAGYRTLLVDGDIRRGDLHRTFGAERRPGLIDCLTGVADVGGALRTTTHPRLMLLPSGSRRREGPELLGQQRMRDFVAQLRERFEVVVIDSPPLGAGVDPFVLATMTGNLALVLRAGETDRQLAEAKLQILDRLPVRLIGAILNDVRVGEGAYRYYSYSYGYVAGDEESPSLPAGTSA